MSSLRGIVGPGFFNPGGCYATRLREALRKRALLDFIIVVFVILAVTVAIDWYTGSERIAAAWRMLSSFWSLIAELLAVLMRVAVQPLAQFWESATRTLLTLARVFARSEKLSKALSSLQSADITNFPIPDKAVGRDWKPFRVEHGVTGSIRGEISGGRLRGSMTSNLLDSSSVLCLQNEHGETMRTLIPNPATTIEMLAQALDAWRQSAGYERFYYEEYDRREQDTHTSRVIDNFAHWRRWANELTHPDIIDMIDASCQRPEDQRPLLRLNGILVQKGVALAASIEVNGEQRTFVPIGFFRALTTVVRHMCRELSSLASLLADCPNRQHASGAARRPIFFICCSLRSSAGGRLARKTPAAWHIQSPISIFLSTSKYSYLNAMA